jgi:hypothetical protein
MKYIWLRVHMYRSCIDTMCVWCSLCRGSNFNPNQSYIIILDHIGWLLIRIPGMKSDIEPPFVTCSRGSIKLVYQYVQLITFYVPLYVCFWLTRSEFTFRCSSVYSIKRSRKKLLCLASIKCFSVRL